MNRILSILCALTLALGVSATPLFRHQVPQKADEQKLELRLKQARTDRERQQLIAKYKQAQRSIQQSAISSKRSAVKRHTADVNKLTITRVSSTLDRESGSIFYGLHLDEFAPAFYFDIPVEEGKRDVELGRTYTLADMNTESCEWDDDEWEAHYYTAATFVKTRGEHYDYHIVAIVTDTDGQEWELRYDEPEVIPTGLTVDVNINRPISTQEYISSDQSWLLRATSGNYFVQLAYYSDDTESPVGEFDASAIVFNDTYIGINTGEVDEYEDPIVKDVFFKDGSISVVSLNDGKRLEVRASLLGADGNTYAITLFYALPEAESQATLTATDLKVDTWALELWGELNLFAGKGELNIGLNLYPEDPTDIFTTYELTPSSRSNGYISADGEQFNIYTGTISLSYDAETGQYVVTGTVLAWNNVEYTLDLRSPLPTVTAMTFEGEDLILDIFQGAWQIAGFDANHQDFLSLAVYSASVAGEYTTNQFEQSVTYLAKGEQIYLLSTANITVTYVDEIAGVTGTVLLINQEDELDHVKLTLNIKAHPYIPSEYNLELGDFAFLYYAEGPDVYYEVITADQQQLFKFDILVEQWSPDVEFGKTYTLSEMIEGRNTMGLNFYENEYIQYESVEFTKAATETEGQISLTVKVLDARGNTWNLSFTGADKPITEAMVVELGQANNHIWADGGIEYEMVDKDNTLSCILVFNLSEAEDVEAGILYDTETILLDYSYLSIRRTEYKLTDATFMKEVDGQETSIIATVTDERGYSYELRYFDDGFVLTGETIQVVMQTPIEATYYDDYYEWAIHAETEYRIAHFGINSLNSESPVGTFTEDEVSTWSSHLEFLLEDEPAEDGTPNWLYLTLHSIDYVTITATEDGYALEASVVGDDANVYEVYVNIDPSAVENTFVKAAAPKRILNGQLLIISGERTYNAQGLIIK